jgi:hypothetical protein
MPEHETPQPTSTRQLHGSLVVGIIFLLATVLGAYAWWHRFRSDPRCREFWGVDALRLVEFAPQVEFLELRPVGDPAGSKAEGEQLQFDNVQLEVAGRGDIGRVPGLLHARHALVMDASFYWPPPSHTTAAQWDFGWRMRDGSQQVTIAFDRRQGRLWWLEANRGLTMVPPVAEAFSKKRDEWRRAAGLH